MKVLTLIQRMHREYAGDAKYPTPGSDNWKEYLDIANGLIEDLATDIEHPVPDYWDEIIAGTVAMSTTLEYDLDDNVAFLSDFVYIDQTDGNTLEFRVVPVKDRALYRNQRTAYVFGADPQQLKFSYLPSSAVGGTIRLGVYIKPDPMTSPNATVPCPRPTYVALAGAAKLSFNDPAKEENFGDLNGQANDQYLKIIDGGLALPGDQPRTVPQAGYVPIGGCFE